jgi:hypothetical protein
MNRLTHRGLGALAALALALPLGAGGCHTFKYFDITMTFDQASFDDADIRTISRCRVLVSGAESANFILDKCPDVVAADPHMGTPPGYVFEYASFADSGTLTFDLKAYTGLRDVPECLLGEGTKPIPVTSATTIMGSLSVVKNPAWACSNTTPPTD